MLTVSILPLVVLLSEQAPRAFAGPSDIAGRMANETGWTRTGYGALLREDERFYTLEYATTTVRPKRQAHRTSKLAREPRFISFQTTDSSIDVELNFAIPFMSIPVQKSMNGLVDSVLKVSNTGSSNGRHQGYSYSGSGSSNRILRGAMDCRCTSSVSLALPVVSDMRVMTPYIPVSLAGYTVGEREHRGGGGGRCADAWWRPDRCGRPYLFQRHPIVLAHYADGGWLASGGATNH
ncbi:uncharacterized protein LOC125951077 [Anopheles darlingi]|uniref:uncharacterized protein LOC125951077 n=1 Tax=Anopheles darlingi TaxID=43151 RepID=UPI00210043F5|nr:uncharacterized protein LOC125951077 [Anopheles darlingi]